MVGKRFERSNYRDKHSAISVFDALKFDCGVGFLTRRDVLAQKSPSLQKYSWEKF
jgi:hypothetical protein